MFESLAEFFLVLLVCAVRNVSFFCVFRNITPFSLLVLSDSFPFHETIDSHAGADYRTALVTMRGMAL